MDPALSLPADSRDTVDAAITELSRLVDEALAPPLDLDQEAFERSRSETS